MKLTDAQRHVFLAIRDHVVPLDGLFDRLNAVFTETQGSA